MVSVDGDTRILVVDDDPAMRLVLREILEQDGHAVEEAEDGEAALWMCERNRPDVVLLDVKMPVWTGSRSALGSERDSTPRTYPS